MRIIRTLAAALCLLCLAAPTAFAEDASGTSRETGQYIVYLPEAPETRELALTAVPYAEGYYIADSVNDVLPLMTGEAEALVASNETLELLDAPNDPKLGKQWYLETIGMDELWDAGYDGEGVTVALIDSGVYAGHEEFRDTAITGRNFLGSGDQPDDYGDDHRHGTLVAGILAAGRDNETGGTGLTPQASVIALRCFSANKGSANSGSGTLDTILSAIGWAIENHADVINMSLGGTNASFRAMEPILRQAADAGILVVAAVGNSGGTELFYPAAFACVTGVGWTDKTDVVHSQHNESVFVTAPGSGIYGPSIGSASAYQTSSGSSFSAPLVSALAVMAKQTDSAIDHTGFQSLLRLCARDMGDEGWDEYYGYGIVSAKAFAQALEAPQPIVYECGGGRVMSGDAPESYRIGRGAETALPMDAEREGCTFAGWYSSEDCVGEPLTAIPAGSVGEVVLYAKWEPKRYTVTWLDEDGSELDTTTVEYGAFPAHEAPDGSETDEYSYSFVRWVPEVVPVTGDASYTASYAAKQKPVRLTLTILAGEDGATYCEAAFLCEPSVSGTAYAARYDAAGRFLGCETMALQAGECRFSIRFDGSATVRFFALDTRGVPYCAAREKAADEHP